MKNRPTMAPRKKSSSTLTSNADTSSNATQSGVAAGKSFRSSTARKREELEQRQQEREALRLKMLKKQSAGAVDLAEFRRLTQEELLAEAKITEKINLASLGILE
jgi:vacuolar protein sorting-associated protein 72